MNLLAIDTSTRWAGVGLKADDGTPLETTWRSDQNHGRELMPAVSSLLEQAKLHTSDITHLAVALGPGGFSAVRVGISTTIGLALPQDLPVVGVSTHHIEARPFFEHALSSSPLVSLLPAGRGEVAWARFLSPTAEPETGVSDIASLIGSGEQAARYCGEGTELIRGKIDSSRILSGQSPTRSPSVLLTIAQERFKNGEQTPLAELRPIYARPPSITMPKQPG